MTIESHDDGGRNRAVVLLEVNEAAGENENFPSFDGLRDEHVGGGDESHQELAVEHEDDLRRTWVQVRRVESSGSVVDAAEGDAESVESGDA